MLTGSGDADFAELPDCVISGSGAGVATGCATLVWIAALTIVLFRFDFAAFALLPLAASCWLDDAQFDGNGLALAGLLRNPVDLP
ncbi:MAG: hypothetical protein NWT00_05850 [Beijerinckiaceae bacterium]|nr:hypothetical protein [Beijerinckiaceae bacterium]